MDRHRRTPLLRQLPWPAAAALAALILLSGCPARRPGPGGTSGIADLNAEVAALAASDPAAGRTAAVVLGNVALVGINLDNPQRLPGADSQPAPRTGASSPAESTREQAPPGPGTRTTPQGQTSAPGVGNTMRGPGGELRGIPARPGGGPEVGTPIPGGTPTQVPPGGPATADSPESGAGTAPMGSSHEQVQNRIATSIRGRFPFIAEVRYTRTAEQGARLAALAYEASAGQPLTDELPELAAMARAMVAADGLTPMPNGPPGSGEYPVTPHTQPPNTLSR